jgi:hypothetical protein
MFKTFICWLIKKDLNCKMKGEKLRRSFPAILLIVMLGLMLSQICSVKSQSLPWDLNGDGVIDLKDLSILAQAYRSTPASPNWNEKADLAEPWGVIDLADLVTLAVHYGEHL